MEQARELVKLAGPEGVLRVPGCEQADPVLAVLGYRMRQGCGKDASLETAEPDLPAALGDRPADNWRPLLAIAPRRPERFGAVAELAQRRGGRLRWGWPARDRDQQLQ